MILIEVFAATVVFFIILHCILSFIGFLGKMLTSVANAIFGKNNSNKFEIYKNIKQQKAAKQPTNIKQQRSTKHYKEQKKQEQTVRPVQAKEQHDAHKRPITQQEQKEHLFALQLLDKEIELRQQAIKWAKANKLLSLKDGDIYRKPTNSEIAEAKAFSVCLWCGRLNRGPKSIVKFCGRCGNRLGTAPGRIVTKIANSNQNT